MFEKVTFSKFKNFDHAELNLGNFSVLIGTNASGKSNVRDAFRFLHGIGRGYSLADIIGEKYFEGGVLQWRGIRGGPRELGYRHSPTFTLGCTFSMEDGLSLRYSLEVMLDTEDRIPRVSKESLYEAYSGDLLFDAHLTNNALHHPANQSLKVRVDIGENSKLPTENFNADQPVLAQIVARLEKRKDVKAVRLRKLVNEIMTTLGSMRFLDFQPDIMRETSYPGQNVLGDRGENLSSVLQAICRSDQTKLFLLQWLQLLIPVDVTDFDFVAYPNGKVQLFLVENGYRVSADSVSDGTLRFLAMLTVLYDPDPDRFYFFEELEAGIHPTRLYLLLELIENKVAERKIQIVTTSHSPQLLRFLSKESRNHTSLVYRLPGQPAARIRSISDIPDVKEIVEHHDWRELHDSGWFEDVVNLLEDDQLEGEPVKSAVAAG